MSTIEMPRYRCHKEVRALKIKSIIPGQIEGDAPGATIVPDDPKLAPFSVDEAYLHKHNPQPGGYVVLYADGYLSFSPAKAFEGGYTLA